MGWEDIKEKIASLEIRDKLNENSGLISIAAVVVVVAALGWSGYEIFGTHRPTYNTKVTFMDTETKEIEIHDATEIPPLIGKSGKPTVVRAYFFTCDGNCKDKKLYFLERYTPEAQKALQDAQKSTEQSAAQMDAVMTAHSGLQVRLPDGGDKDWVTSETPEGQKIYSSINCGDNASPMPCNEP